MKKYYHAYDERYKKIHEEGLLWCSDQPTPEVMNWVEYYNIPLGEEICEIGCGEGRDALHLAECFLQEEIPHFCKSFSPGTGGEFLCQPNQ